MKQEISVYKDKLDKKGLKCTVELALARIKNGKKREQIEALRQAPDKASREKIKATLSAVTFSGSFSERLDSKLIQHSGLMTLDFDDVQDIPYLRETLEKWKYTMACWLSPSGTGYKALVKISQPGKHREHFFALEHEWKKMGFEIDKACKNESRLCFESYDPDIYINPKSAVYGKFALKEYSTPVAPITEKEKEGDDYKIFENIKQWAAKNGQHFIEGNRNNFVMRIAGACSRFGLQEHTAASFIRNDFVANDKSFSENELLTTVKSAYRANKHQHGTQVFEKDKIVNRKTRQEEPEAIKIFDTEEKVADIVRALDVKDEIKKLFKEGYVGAETTHVKELDEIWKWVRGEANLFSGIGNSGKSTLLMQLMLIKSLKAQTKWVIFSPESFPAKQFFWELIEMLVGQACTPNAFDRPEYKVIEKAIEFINEHFFYIEASEDPTPDYIRTKFMECVILYGCDGCLIDPFNQLANDYESTGGRDDKYLEKNLPIFHKFAKAQNIFMIFVAHPKTMQMRKGEINYPCPEVFDLSGGAMWNNKMDNIVMVHRPQGQSDPDDPTVEIHTKKIRFSARTGRRGVITIYYNWRARRYSFSPDQGPHPLDDFMSNLGIEIKPKPMMPNTSFDAEGPKPRIEVRDYSEPMNSRYEDNDEEHFNFNVEADDDVPF